MVITKRRSALIILSLFVSGSSSSMLSLDVKETCETAYNYAQYGNRALTMASMLSDWNILSSDWKMLPGCNTLLKCGDGILQSPPSTVSSFKDVVSWLTFFGVKTISLPLGHLLFKYSWNKAWAEGRENGLDSRALAPSITGMALAALMMYRGAYQKKFI